jgi:hypothetical protein
MLIGLGQLTPPIAGSPTISSLFGPRAQPTAGASTDHQGIDYAVPVGTPVLAAGAGTVIFAGVQSGYGNTVVIDNGNGVTTLYGHLSSIGVSVGQSVSDGDQVALLGATGTVSGPNLHFQVDINGVPVDPTTQLLPADSTDDSTDLSNVTTAGLVPSLDMFTAAFTDLGTAFSSGDFSGMSDSDWLVIGGGFALAAFLAYQMSRG